jgi:hypothetical protein
MLLDVRKPIDSEQFPGTGFKKWIKCASSPIPLSLSRKGFSCHRLDWIGTILCLGITTSVLLPLQEGGNTKEWSDPEVYALFVVAAVLIAG